MTICIVEALEVMINVIFFLIIGQLSRSKGYAPTGRSCIYITRNIHVKYQSSSTQYLKVSSKVKVSDRFTECQKDGMTE